MNDQEEIYCYHCEEPFFIRGFKLRNAKTVSCLFCNKRIDKKKSKEAIAVSNRVSTKEKV